MQASRWWWRSTPSTRWTLLAGEREGANVLYLPSQLPAGVYFVLARRKVPLPFTVQARQDLYDLAAHRGETRRDVQTYVIRATARRS
jgi:hypothetical protein